MTLLSQSSLIDDNEVGRLEEAGILTFKQLLESRVDTIAVCMEAPTSRVEQLLNMLHRVPQLKVTGRAVHSMSASAKHDTEYVLQLNISVEHSDTMVAEALVCPNIRVFVLLPCKQGLVLVSEVPASTRQFSVPVPRTAIQALDAAAVDEGSRCIQVLVMNAALCESVPILSSCTSF